MQENELELVELPNLPRCYRLTNGTVEVTIARDVGPRILGYNLIGAPNVLGLVPEGSQATPWGDWKPWGGHRLWLAPESMPESYVPDNSSVEVVSEGELSARVIGNYEKPTGVRKEIVITLANKGTGVQITHRLTNEGPATVSASLWALTIMRGGGVAVVPQEPFRPFPEVLQPVRPLALWSYTNLSDPRFEISADYVRLKTDSSKTEPQKFGVGNAQGWCGYLNDGVLFVKRFSYDRSAMYPDFGCNNEIYTAGSFIELESLSPIHRLERGSFAEHTEQWELLRGDDLELLQLPSR